MAAGAGSLDALQSVVLLLDRDSLFEISKSRSLLSSLILLLSIQSHFVRLDYSLSSPLIPPFYSFSLLGSTCDSVDYTFTQSVCVSTRLHGFTHLHTLYMCISVPAAASQL